MITIYLIESCVLTYLPTYVLYIPGAIYMISPDKSQECHDNFNQLYRLSLFHLLSFSSSLDHNC